jgi:CheY-like chemotaxis protein
LEKRVMAIRIQHRVLIVEDHAQTRNVFATLLRMNNYTVFEAGDGAEAFPILKTGRPHVLISDLHMPRMDGYVLLRLVAGSFPEIGVIVLSGTFEQCRGTSGPIVADAFFAKGACSTRALLHSVADLARRFPLRRAARSGALSLAWVPQESPHSLWTACTECMASFSLDARPVRLDAGVHRTHCPSCSAQVKFLLEETALRRLAFSA